MKQIRSSRAKIQLHINDNTKLSLRDYRELIYNEIAQKKKALANCNFHSENQSRGRRADPKKKDGKEKSKGKTHESSDRKFLTFESSQSKEDRVLRKDIKSSMERSVKSRP
jgi:hypothetical protein